jgi:orotate phosphoribosyltransferase-like protein
MIISDFTAPELEYFRENCNFVNLEKQIFERRAEGISLQQIAENLNISYDYARHLSRKVNKKILKVL